MEQIASESSPQVSEHISILHIGESSRECQISASLQRWRQAHADIELGFVLTCTRQFDDGLRLLKPNRFSVVLLDIYSDDPDSLDKVGILSSEYPEIPVIVLIIDNDHDFASRAIKAGAQDYLFKDHLNDQIMMRTIRYTIEKHKLSILLRNHLRDLRASRERFRNIIERNADAIIIVDKTGTVRFANKAAGKLFDREASDLPGELFGFPIVAKDTAEIDIFRKDGKKAIAEMRVVESEWSGESVFLATLRDVTKRREAEEEMEKMRKFERHLAYHDTLTNLPNRSLFYDRLNQAINQTKRANSLTAILFLDLDGFKWVNDSLGHSKGDMLLQIVAQKLKRCIRESDTVARLGGDEFTVMLPNLDNATNAAVVARKILETLSKPLSISGNEIHITASVGISVFPTDAEDIESLMRFADIAMYRAKAKGKNNFQMFDPSIDVIDSRRFTIEKGLRNAVDNLEFVVHYQPQVDINTGKMIGSEALLRWQNPDFGLLYPTEFIPLAEETGLIVNIGKWLLRKVCEQNRKWQKTGYDPIRISLNLSARQFSEDDLVDDVVNALNDTKLDPQYLELEITESCAMQDLEYTVETLHALKSRGVRLSVDDFGTGYSSMGYLKRYPVDTLKIDQSFVKNLPSDKDNSAITTAIIAMAHSLGKKTIAEGVETDEQVRFLKSLRCDEMQGFHVSKPLTSDSLEELLRKRSAPSIPKYC
ncbi:MAG: EAL domain-containing protein [candidate division Zixibacteria bacterium]|nr:EAL domain-containing protein [candidate division Zixibacteria bacterium]